jgi:hypothetical protein
MVVSLCPTVRIPCDGYKMSVCLMHVSLPLKDTMLCISSSLNPVCTMAT